MNEENFDIELAVVIVNFGLGSQVLKVAKENGIIGGTIFLGQGTIKQPFLEFLGITDVRKEVVFMITDSEIAKKSLSLIEEKFKMKKKKSGIAFTMPINYFYGSHDKEKPSKKGVEKSMYNCIYVIVDKGKGNEVIESADRAGSKGGTIINGRGASAHETSKLFSMAVEPEKEVVMILAENEITEKIVEQIKTDLEIAKPGNGVLFVQNVNQTYGMKRPEID